MHWRGLLCFVLLLVGCGHTVQRMAIGKDELARPHEKQSLRAHLVDGSLLVLDPWRLDEAGARVVGEGVRLDPQRNVVAEGLLDVALDGIAVLEVDELKRSEWPIAMTAVTLLSVAGTIACAANPKACFGSCPTFYLGEHLAAEGFSASFAPAFEASDLDHLGALPARDGVVSISMRNEALETHYVREVELYFGAHGPDESLAQTLEGAVWRVRPAAGLMAPHVEELARVDGNEYFTPADSTDLATKQELELHFATPPVGAARYGVVVDSRQSLLSTYLFYQGIAYLGSHYGRWLASLRGDAVSSGAEGIVERLGGIELQCRQGVSWRTLGTIAETGPLAIDRKLIPLPEDWDPDRDELRLRMTRGMWRIDAVELVAMLEESPLERRPLRALRGDDGIDPEREALLRDPERHLCTWPGEFFDLEFEAAAAQGSYFLRSRGYYVEWMREDWLREENPMLALAMFRQPEETLRRLAPQYKRIESQMETIFWESRYARP